MQADGKIIVGGAFATINGVARNRVARLNSDGSLDPTFIAAYTTGVTVTQVAMGLSQPLAVRHAGDGSGRLFIVQQGGAIRWMNGAGVLQNDPFFTMASVTTCAVAGLSPASFGFSGSSGERGLLGLAFDPDFGDLNQHFFVNFTDARGDTVVARFTATGDTTDYASCRVVLRVDQDFSNHNGGDLHFGPDGFLYIAMGDGGSGGDPCNRAQTLNPANLINVGGSNGNGDCVADTNFQNIGAGNSDSRALLGKMLRIDVDGQTIASDAAGICGRRTGGSNGDVVAFYSIPAPVGDANPFLGADPATGCDEVWSYGWRNPWRFSFDRATGDLIVGDVGQGTTEEISFELAAAAGGSNFGWDVCEGPFQTGSRSDACPTVGAISPILEFSSQDNMTTNPTSRCSITGGYRYRGNDIEFSGTYVYGDYCSGEILMAREESPGLWTAEVWTEQNVSLQFNLVGFGESEVGDLYVAASGLGRIYRFDIDRLFGDGFEDVGP